MPTVADTLELAALSLPFCRVDVDKSAFRGPVLDPTLPEKILILKGAVDWAYGQSTTYADIEETGNFLYSLLDKYALQASGSLGLASPIDSGVVVEAVQSVSIFPLRKTSADFTTATFYPDTRLYGNTISVFYNGIPRFLLATEFSVDATGLHILLPGFDATTDATIEIWIYKVNT